MTEQKQQDFPTHVPGERTWFDRLADHATALVANASFFVICAGFVLVWLAFGLVAKVAHLHEWSDALAVPAAGVTLLMVALLQNEQRRNDQAMHRKLNAVSESLAQIMDRFDLDEQHQDELRSAVGLERRESTAMDEDKAGRIAGRRN